MSDIQGKITVNTSIEEIFNIQIELIKEQQQELTDLKAKYQKAVEALKYYGSTSLGETGAWGFRKKFCFDLVQTEDLEFLPEPICENGKKYIIGGKLARQTLAELGEKE